MKKLIKWTLITLGGLTALLVLTGMALSPAGKKIMTRSYPDIQAEMVAIPTSPDAIERGRHIAIVWTCTKCHGDNLGGKILSGDPMIGTIPASNLTSGRGGIAGYYTDADWIRAIRYGVKPDGQAEIFMNDFSSMSNQDLGDLIAYLKQIPPVDSDLPARRFGPLVPVALALGIGTPAVEAAYQPGQRPADPVPGATIEYGEYLSVLCNECHSPKVASSMKDWTKEDFIQALQAGVLPDGSKLGNAMAMSAFDEMNDMELTALWLYYQELALQVSEDN